MDYALDFYFGPAPVPTRVPSPFLPPYASFVYDDPRFFSKLYVFLKSLGFLFYITTLPRCDNPLFFILMNGMMCLSTANSARYEYRHYQRYGTIFSSIHDYEHWKVSLWPKTRIVFSLTELSLKFVYFIYTFPPRFAFSSVCDNGKSAFIIHSLALFFVYIIIGVFSVWVLTLTYCYDSVNTRTLDAVVAGASVLPLTRSSNEECCICLENGELTGMGHQWAILPCQHKFHAVCILRWLIINNTCPVCRLSIECNAYE
jgi:hypothetical protein